MKYAAPSADDCGICENPLGTVALKKVRRGWVHLACWLLEKGE